MMTWSKIMMTEKDLYNPPKLDDDDAVEEQPSSKRRKRHVVLPILAVGFPISFFVLVLYLAGGSPYPTIGAACLCFIYFCIHIFQRDKPEHCKIDVQLSFFLASQLLLSYFSRYDPFKAPNGDSPFSASADFRVTNKHLRLHLAELFIGESENAKWLEVIEFICLFSWVFILLISLTETKEKVFQGRTRRLVFSLLILSYVFLHGIMAGLNGVSHRFYVAAYGFVSLFLEANFGIDSHPFVCLFAGYTFFSAGVSKIINSEFTWHDGQALCRFIGGNYSDAGIAKFCAVTAKASIGFELVTPFLLLPIFGLAGRVIYVVLALCFHLSIALLMFPRYTSQSCAYSLLFRTNPPTNKPKGRQLFAAICGVLIATMAFRIEIWPLTAVPMYSTNLPNEFGSTMQEAYHAARIVEFSQSIGDFAEEETSVEITMEGGSSTCGGGARNVWVIAATLAKPKLIKLFLIRGLSSALVCNEKLIEEASSSVGGTGMKHQHYCESNYWFDKFSNAVHDECPTAADTTIHYSLILQSNPPQSVRVYSWKRSPTSSVTRANEPSTDKLFVEQQQQEHVSTF